ncbi:protein ABHD13-like [Dreissena polymorpha]|uniref:Serine aminopeptidase S33 domain-containing protein n=1 Tax=Dreissena polymorpha TaxID=45954 RepID=A0A9D4BQ74_DREPO|nr:protein ABHD13-like [Dreissena polymorpha]KAH3712381.1 hypothetical protein DPMN_072081 [Dreissena polymorpha]
MTDNENSTKVKYQRLATDSSDQAPKSATMARSSLYAACRIILYLMKLVIVRFWKLCMSSCLIILLLFWFYGGAVSLMFLMFSVFGLFYYAQDMVLYYPNQPPNSRLFVPQPDPSKLPYENVFVKTRDGVNLNMYFIKQQQPYGYPTVVMFHGNAGNIGHRLHMATCLYSVCHCNILMVEYRGYGRSMGSPSESGLYTDAETGLEWLLNRTDVDKSKIFLFGSSLGGAVAINLVTYPRYTSGVTGLILENTFTSLPEMAKMLIKTNLLDMLPSVCHKNQFYSIMKIQKVMIPTLFLSGQADELIPPKMMQDLYQRSGSSLKRLVPFERGTHNETCLCPKFYETIAAFMYEVVNQSAGKSDTAEVAMETQAS